MNHCTLVGGERSGNLKGVPSFTAVFALPKFGPCVRSWLQQHKAYTCRNDRRNVRFGMPRLAPPVRHVRLAPAWLCFVCRAYDRLQWYCRPPLAFGRWYIPIVYGIYPNRVSQSYIPIVYPNRISQSYIQIVYPNRVSQSYIPIVYPNRISQSCIPIVYPNRISQSYVPMDEKKRMRYTRGRIEAQMTKTITCLPLLLCASRCLAHNDNRPVHFLLHALNALPAPHPRMLDASVLSRVLRRATTFVKRSR